MKTIKIIDLYNKIANGEEIPKKIKYNNIIFSIRKDIEDYTSEDESWFTDCFSLLDLNDEVEIIEDELIHFSEEENQALKNIIKKNSVPLKDNFFDYYEDTPVKENKKIDKLNLIFENNLIKENFDGGTITYLSEYTPLKMIFEKQCEIIDKINGEKENE